MKYLKLNESFTVVITWYLLNPCCVLDIVTDDLDSGLCLCYFKAILHRHKLSGCFHPLPWWYVMQTGDFSGQRASLRDSRLSEIWSENTSWASTSVNARIRDMPPHQCLSTRGHVTFFNMNEMFAFIPKVPWILLLIMCHQNLLCQNSHLNCSVLWSCLEVGSPEGD